MPLRIETQCFIHLAPSKDERPYCLSSLLPGSPYLSASHPESPLVHLGTLEGFDATGPSHQCRHRSSLRTSYVAACRNPSSVSASLHKQGLDINTALRVQDALALPKDGSVEWRSSSR